MQAVSKPRGVTPRMKQAKGGETGGDGQGAPGRARGGGEQVTAPVSELRLLHL